MKDTELFLVNPTKVLMAYIEWLLSAKLNSIIRADKERVVRVGCTASQLGALDLVSIECSYQVFLLSVLYVWIHCCYLGHLLLYPIPQHEWGLKQM